MTASSLGKTRVARRLGFAIPLGLTVMLSMLMRPEAGSLLAPAFGPWAGLLYGHSDCTMASVFPVVAFALVALGAVSILAVRRLNRGRARSVALWVTGLWAVAWEIMALLSVVNTTS